MQCVWIEEGGQTDIESQYVGEGEQGADRGRLLCQRMDGRAVGGVTPTLLNRPDHRLTYSQGGLLPIRGG